MLYFTTENVGKTRRKTPDGFLICLDVPIARTGRMVYTKRDLPNFEPGPDGTIQVDRFANELFRPETIASFEGMPLCNDHPTGVMMEPKYFKLFTVGHQQNVRRGTGDMDDCLLADLFVMDEDAIKAIEEDDKVQVSAGYDAAYRQSSLGHLEQFNIVGNHTAFVFSGRCGPRCAVGDQAPVIEPPSSCGCVGACNCEEGIPMSTRPKLKEALQATATSLSNVMKTLDEAPNVENEGGTHVHLHMPGGKDEPGGIGDKRTADEDNNEGSTKITEMLDSIANRMNTMEDVLADFTEDRRMMDARDKRFKDAGESEEDAAKRKEKEAEARDARRRARDSKNLGGGENPLGDRRTADEETPEDKEKREKEEKATDARHRDGEASEEELEKLKGKTTDAAHNSAGLEEEFTNALALAQIIAPGLSVPTFDSATHVASTAKSLCNLRRRALANALQRQETKDAIASLVDSVKTLDAMPCAAVRVAFNGAGQILRSRVNDKVGGTLARIVGGDVGSTGKGVKTPAQINAENRARWAR